MISDEDRVVTLSNFGYPLDYVKYTILENEANYAVTAYYLLGTDQNYWAARLEAACWSKKVSDSTKLLRTTKQAYVRVGQRRSRIQPISLHALKAKTVVWTNIKGTMLRQV